MTEVLLFHPMRMSRAVREWNWPGSMRFLIDILTYINLSRLSPMYNSLLQDGNALMDRSFMPTITSGDAWNMKFRQEQFLRGIESDGSRSIQEQEQEHTRHSGSVPGGRLFFI